MSAWNRLDGRAFAATFTPRAEYVTSTGRLLQGRRAIRRLVASARGSAIRLEGRLAVRMYGESASVRLHWRSKARRGVITLVAVFDGEWRIDRLQNTDVS